MKLLPKITLACTLVLAPALSFATEGKVISYQPSCGYLLIEAVKGEEKGKGYLLLKDQGGSKYHPKKDDLVDGIFLENYGITHLHKISSTEVMWVYNESTWLSKDQAAKKFAAKCGS
jgi:hypothetical protein